MNVDKLIDGVIFGGIYQAPEGQCQKDFSQDTQECINEDALKPLGNYWGCIGKPCTDCPVMIDGETPAQRYGLDKYSCYPAKVFDLLRRQRELDKRNFEDIDAK